MNTLRTCIIQGRVNAHILVVIITVGVVIVVVVSVLITFVIVAAVVITFVVIVVVFIIVVMCRSVGGMLSMYSEDDPPPVAV